MNSKTVKSKVLCVLDTEKAKKRRTSQRGTFTKALNALNEFLDAGEDQKRILIAYQILEEKKNVFWTCCLMNRRRR